MIKVAVTPTGYTDKLMPGDPRWGKFNASFVNLELEPIDFAQAAWDGRAYTTWHKDSWRVTDNYMLGQHIGLDFDTEDKRSSMDHLLAEPFIQSYASFLYSTPSHTDEAPRCRVVFLLDSPIYQAKNYTLAASALIWLFAGISDSKIHDACRFFYGAGPEPQAAFPGQILPLKKLRQIIGMYKQTGEAAIKMQEQQRKRNGRGNGKGKFKGTLSTNTLLDRALAQASFGHRNHHGTWLACQLRDNGFSAQDAEGVMSEYAFRCPQGKDKYTRQEAVATMRSVYRSAARSAWS